MLQLAVAHSQRTDHMGAGMSRSLWSFEYRTRQKSDGIKVKSKFWYSWWLQESLKPIYVLRTSDSRCLARSWAYKGPEASPILSRELESGLSPLTSRLRWNIRPWKSWHLRFAVVFPNIEWHVDRSTQRQEPDPPTTVQRSSGWP